MRAATLEGAGAYGFLADGAMDPVVAAVDVASNGSHGLPRRCLTVQFVSSFSKLCVRKKRSRAS